MTKRELLAFFLEIEKAYEAAQRPPVIDHAAEREAAIAACRAKGEDPEKYPDYADLRSGKQLWEYYLPERKPFCPKTRREFLEELFARCEVETSALLWRSKRKGLAGMSHAYPAGEDRALCGYAAAYPSFLLEADPKNRRCYRCSEKATSK